MRLRMLQVAFPAQRVGTCRGHFFWSSPSSRSKVERQGPALDRNDCSVLPNVSDSIEHSPDDAGDAVFVVAVGVLTLDAGAGVERGGVTTEACAPPADVPGDEVGAGEVLGTDCAEDAENRRRQDTVRSPAAQLSLVGYRNDVAFEHLLLACPLKYEEAG